MNAQRLMKEARPLFWPWCAVILAGLSPWIFRWLQWSSDFSQMMWVVGWFAGIPLLATLPMGMEFQNNTLSLLLSQPIERKSIWAVKICMVGLVAASAAQVFVLAENRFALLPDFAAGWDLESWLLPFVAAAIFWTLFARSTVGGVVLNLASGLVVAVVVNQLFLISGFAMAQRTLGAAWFVSLVLRRRYAMARLPLFSAF